MRMRSLILLCLVMAVVGAVFVWGRYYKTDPVSAEAAMQQQAPAQGPTQNAQQAAPQSTPQPAPESGKPAVAVRVSEVTQASMPIRRRTIGWVEPIASVAIKSRINSVIMEQHATDGAFVNKGDVLFVLDDREAKATIARDEAAMAQHQAEVERAHGDLERTKTLVAKQTASKQTLDQVVAAARAAEAAVAADKAILQADRLTLSYTTITAPISGRLGAVAVTPGNLVAENGDVALVTITQMQPIRLSFTLPDRDIDALRAALAQYPPAAVRVFTKGEKTARAQRQPDLHRQHGRRRVRHHHRQGRVREREPRVVARPVFRRGDRARRRAAGRHHPDRRAPGRPGRPVRLRGHAGQQGRDAQGHGHRQRRREERRDRRLAARRARGGGGPAPPLSGRAGAGGAMRAVAAVR